MYTIFSYGAPRISLGDLSVQFGEENSAGEVTFIPEEESYETLSGRLIRKFKGYRVEAKLKLYNFKGQDYRKHLNLINIINTSRRENVPILVQPRFSGGATLSIWMRTKDNIKYQEITNLNAGQIIELTFESEELMSEIPLIVNLPRYLMLDSEHYLLLSAEGNRLIIPETVYEEININGEVSFS